MCMQASKHRTTERVFRSFIEIDSVVSYEAVVLKTAERSRSMLRLNTDLQLLCLCHLVSPVLQAAAFRGSVHNTRWLQPGRIRARTHVCSTGTNPQPPPPSVTLVGNCLGVRAKHIYGQLVIKAGPCEVAIETVKLSRAAARF